MTDFAKTSLPTESVWAFVKLSSSTETDLWGPYESHTSRCLTCWFSTTPCRLYNTQGQKYGNKEHGPDYYHQSGNSMKIVFDIYFIPKKDWSLLSVPVTGSKLLWPSRIPTLSVVWTIALIFLVNAEYSEIRYHLKLLVNPICGMQRR